MIVALLAWYEEPPSWLAATAASLANVADHLVAVDGAYLLYPGGMVQPRSGCEQAEALTETCHAANLGLTVHRPKVAWAGNEIEKRNFMFQAGRLIASPTDWFLCIDADEVVTSAPADLNDRLATADEDVAGVTFWQRNALQEDGWPNDLPANEGFTGHRVLFRALPELHVADAHHHYRAGDRFLRGDHSKHQLEPYLDVPDLKIEHRHQYRKIDRLRAAASYYTLRDQVGAEAPGSPGGINV